jgi:cytosine/adenosine deaminase-related metal-dependent hydrolase
MIAPAGQAVNYSPQSASKQRPRRWPWGLQRCHARRLPSKSHRWNEVTDGAVLQEDGTIVELGTYQELSSKHPNVAVVGSGNEVMLPGFVNGHHHIGLTRCSSARRTCRS